MQRWMEQKTKEQPFESVETFAVASLPKPFGAGRDTGSINDVAGSARHE